MKEQKMKFVIVICLLSVFSFSSFAQTGDPLKSSKVVAKKVKVNGNDVVVCDQSLFDNTITIPLSAFTEELQIVKLDESPNLKTYTSQRSLFCHTAMSFRSGRNPFLFSAFYNAKKHSRNYRIFENPATINRNF